MAIKGKRVSKQGIACRYDLQSLVKEDPEEPDNESHDSEQSPVCCTIVHQRESANICKQSFSVSACRSSCLLHDHRYFNRMFFYLAC